jgi:hypothetical protein
MAAASMVILLLLTIWECIKMNKVFIVIDMSEGMGPRTVLRVFSKYDDALVYGEDLLFDGVVNDFDIYEREVY